MKAILAALLLAAIPTEVLLAAKGEKPGKTQTVTGNSHVDYAKFVEIAKEVQPYRKKRRVTEQQFLKLSQQEGALILDTRSEWAFNQTHLDGAVHLNFSDFTKQSLARVLGKDKNRLVLIYCNNNFRTNDPSLYAKSAPAALNIPTFVTLYTYGYKNVYELGPVVDLDNTPLTLVRTAEPTQRTRSTK